MKIDGKCHCGDVTYEAEIDPEDVMVCHCEDCQALSGSAFRTVALTRKGTFRLISGVLKIYVKTAESGNQRQQSFCPRCGSPIYSTSMDDGPKVHSIRLGTVNQRRQLTPRKQIWARSRQPWIDELTSIESIEKR